jgi:hypothetical protein
LAMIAAGAGVFVWRSSSPSPVATDSIARRADAGAPSISNPMPTKIAAAPTSTPSAAAATEPATPAASPVAKANSDASPSLEAKLKAVEAQLTPAVAAAPALAASAASEPTPLVSSPSATASLDAPPPREVKVKTDEAPLTPLAPPPTPAALPASEPQIALAAPVAKPNGADLAALTPLVAAELRRLGCYVGAATDWDAVDLRLGVGKFAELAKLRARRRLARGVEERARPFLRAEDVRAEPGPHARRRLRCAPAQAADDGRGSRPGPDRRQALLHLQRQFVLRMTRA